MNSNSKLLEPNLSVKNVTSQCRIPENGMGIVGDIGVLVKYFPRRQKFLGDLLLNTCGTCEDDIWKVSN